ncbi:MAG: flagellar M-ring protein FliF [Halioglobus sp.]|jgi:flagellar M-ring protein FliF
MASDSQNLLDRFISISSQPAVKQLRLLLGLAASIALGIGLVQWALAPDFTPLYGELSPASSAEVVQSLEASGIRYELNNRTGTISVPNDQVRRTRLALAGEGLPQGESSGYDILNQDSSMGVSSFMEKARFDRALEQELSNSIASLDSVRAARVHLALPKQSAFVRKKNKPAASVLVSLYAGRELTDSQLAGVVHLVAFSVPGLEAEQVSVVDNKGKLLSSQNSGNQFAATQDNFRYTQQLERSYVSRITEILTPILGIGAVQAQVAADIDFTVVERTSERYDPETSMRSEQLVEELTAAMGASGIPGTLSNQPPAEVEVVAALGAEASAQPAPTRSSKREIRNFELDKTISHTREMPGTLKKLSVAVVVDYREALNDEGVTERMPLEEAELAEITALVREAIGFDEARGDRVNVMNASFIVPPELEPMPEISLMEQEWVWRAGKLALAGIAIFLTIFTVVRPLMQASAHPAPGTRALDSPGNMGGAGMVSADGMALGDDRVTLGQQQQMGLPGGVPAYQQQLSMARSMVEGEPERVASVVKNWVASDG